MSFLPVNQQMEIIKRGTEEILPETELIKKLDYSYNENIPLNVKLGCDPSRADLHIGHGVVLRKLRHFQDLGHQAILVIGDFTAMIGDPSGRNKTRPQLTMEEARENAKSYVDQSKIILDIEKLKIVYNSNWLDKMSFSEVVKLASSTTVARMLERDDFTKRYQSEVSISLHEFLYPLAQGQDSVELKSDIELGGTDQKFNLLIGRNLQKEVGQNPQVIITLPILEGTDGVEKMSKSYGNDISLGENPNDMFGKTLSIPDELMTKWFTLAADVDLKTKQEIENQINDKSINPMIIKRRLAREVVSLFYDKETALAAEKHFNIVSVSKEIPDNIQEYHIISDESIISILSKNKLIKSNSEGRRLIKQGAIKIDGNTIEDLQYTVLFGSHIIIKIGKRRFLKVIS